ncbi:MAG: hypothetical protein H6731_01365 [Myxococcales bacterium]|nr:MAG: hypothetical protein H6731_01365 [Myxococcales bacterium]
MVLVSINKILQYKNPLVIQRFKQAFPDKAHRAEELWINMLKYLWLCKKHEQDVELNPHLSHLQFSCVMHQEMRDMDEMWHAFILITKDYADFCHNYFGEFLHHVPNIREEIVQSEEEFERELHLYLSYVYDQLGEETLKLWFSEYL